MSRPLALVKVLLGMIATCALAAPVVAQERRPLDLATFPRTQLEITPQGSDRGGRPYSFQVWIADTDARAEQGLMFVNDLPETMGMVFPIQPPRVATFWMKNTYIELDMLFIADGRVVKIIEHAPPLRLDLLSSGVPVAAVLELRGGEAGLLGLKVGDEVSWKRTPKAPATR
jgi:uncharacterized protein